MREKHQLHDIEFKQFKRLRPFEGEARRFWAGIAHSRKLDPSSIISNGQFFTGLPLGHREHWCFPIALKCVKKPSYKEG